MAPVAHQRPQRGGPVATAGPVSLHGMGAHAPEPHGFHPWLEHRRGAGHPAERLPAVVDDVAQARTRGHRRTGPPGCAGIHRGPATHGVPLQGRPRWPGPLLLPRSGRQGIAGHHARSLAAGSAMAMVTRGRGPDAAAHARRGARAARPGASPLDHPGQHGPPCRPRRADLRRLLDRSHPAARDGAALRIPVRACPPSRDAVSPRAGHSALQRVHAASVRRKLFRAAARTSALETSVDAAAAERQQAQ